MKEEVLIEGTFYLPSIPTVKNYKKISVILIISGIILPIIPLIIGLMLVFDIDAQLVLLDLTTAFFIIGLISIAVGAIILAKNSNNHISKQKEIYTELYKQSLTVTSSRIYGTTVDMVYVDVYHNYGYRSTYKKLVVHPAKTVNLPIHQISSIIDGVWDVEEIDENLSLLTISTSSGNISFIGLENIQLIKSVLLNLIQQPYENIKQNRNNYEKLNELKTLFDNGTLSKSEFEREKDKILKGQ